MTRATCSPGHILKVVLVAAALLFVGGVLITWHTSVSHPDTPVYGYFLEGLVNTPATLALAFLLAVRLPRHRVTWVFVGMATAAALQLAAGAWAHESLAAGAAAGTAALFVSTGAQSAFVMSWVLLVLVFPTGDAITPRWRVLIWAALIALPLVATVRLVEPRPFVDDPVFSDVSGPLSTVIAPGIASVLSIIAWILTLGSLFGAILQLFLRFRRGSPEIRRQLAWFFYAVVIAVLVLLVPWPGANLLPGWLLWSLAPLGIWAAVAVAILKHRLYDIDLVINRTLVYLCLTGLLALAYLGIVVFLQRVLAPVTRDSDIAVAGSTLAVAALFRPLRARVQSFIDRRFYRSNYDAAETLGRFSSRLRDEVDLDSLSHELVAVVGSTMQPVHAALWLRSTETDERREERGVV